MTRGNLAAALLLPVLALAALPPMSLSTWITLTVAGAAMGMMLFLMASGLTLIFGLMDVLNFAHGAFITLGAYIAVSVFAQLTGWVAAESWVLNLAALGVAILAAAVAGGAVGWLFEQVIVRRVYGSHLQQILITVGGLIVAEQLVVVIWGAQQLQVPKPAMLRGSFLLDGAAIETFRMVAVALGLLVWAAMVLVLEPHADRPAGARRGGEPGDGGGARLPHPPAVHWGCSSPARRWRRSGGVMWAVYQELVTSAIGGDDDHSGVHRGHYRRAWLGHRLLRRGGAGWAG